MLKYCNACKRDLEIDIFYSYKKSTCKECLNKKVKCDYCDKEFFSTNLSKHIKQIHSTHNSSRTNVSTYDSSRTNDSTYANSRTNESTSNSSEKNDSTTNRSPNNDNTSNSGSEQFIDSSYDNLSDPKKVVISLKYGKIILVLIKKVKQNKFTCC